jgi:hypothetical protein
MRQFESVSFDPETIELLRIALEAVWQSLPPDQQARTSKTLLAQRILRSAARGERDPIRLRACALIGVVVAPIN